MENQETLVDSLIDDLFDVIGIRKEAINITAMKNYLTLLLASDVMRRTFQ